MRRRLEAALESLVELIGTTRRRAEREAPLALTTGYARFIIANGFARFGARDRAVQLGYEARVALVDAPEDPIHAYLIAAFAQRLEQAIGGMPRDWPFDEVIVRQLDVLDRVRRHKVDQLREVSPTLAADFVPYDPSVRWVDRSERVLSSDPELDMLRAIADPAVRTERIARAFEQAKPSHPELRAGLDAILELPVNHALSILPRVVRLVPRTSPTLCASALFVVARFEHRHLASSLVDAIGGHLGERGVDLDRTVPVAFRALRRLDMREELGELLEATRRILRPPIRMQLAIAGARSLLGDTTSAIVFERQRQVLVSPISYGKPIERSSCERFRAIAAGATHAEPELALAQLAALADRFEQVTDELNTSSHYCLSVLHVVESLVLAITELAQTSPDGHDAANRVFLRSRFDERST